MKKLIRYHQKISAYLLNRIKRLYNLYFVYILPDDLYVKKNFKIRLGYELNLDNPETLNEKIQWLKIHDRTESHTICADKYAVRGYIKEKIGGEYLIPLLYHTEKPEDITPNNLPNNPFIIKTNHDSGSRIIVRDKSEINWSDIQNKLKASLKKNYYYRSREWQYKNIKPCIIVEKLLLDKNGNIPCDYKLHCFNGKLVFIQVDTNRFVDHRRNLYDVDWNFINCEWVYKNGEIMKKPLMMAQMKILAEKLAKDFGYVRVDFYNIGNKIYFGELTFHPDSGWGRFTPIEYDKKLGKELKLSNLRHKP